MELKLNIYKTPKEIEKTYRCETVELMFGTVEDLLDAIDFENLDDREKLAKGILKLLPKIKPFLKQVFDGLTDEELRRTKVKEIIPLFMQIFVFAMAEFNGMTTEKN